MKLIKQPKFLDKRKTISVIILLLLTVPIIFGFTTPAPIGTSYESPSVGVSDIQFIYDLTYVKEGVLIHENRILDEEIRLIQESRDFIVADLFLYNQFYNTQESQYPKTTERLTNALIHQKKKNPQMSIYLITDEINSCYGAFENDLFKQLRDHGITVIFTDLNKIRDPNPLYSGYWRTYVKPFGVEGKGWIKNPFGTNGPKVNARNLLKLLNFKANHRKVIITDKGALVTSANPHDASAYHSNIAYRLNGEPVQYLLEAEKSVAKFSGYEIEVQYKNNQNESREETEIKILTEDKILYQIINSIKETERGDTIQLGLFYLAHRGVVQELTKAALRDVNIQIILDPSKDAFGYKKNGMPNRQAAHELIKKSNNKIQIRWYDTHGEQYHSKIIAVQKGDDTTIIAGSANFTRRNLNNYNLEMNIMITVSKEDPIAQSFRNYFNRIWHNQEGSYTVDYETYAADSLLKTMVYRVQEATGLCTY